MEIVKSLNTLIVNTVKESASVKSKVKVFFFKDDNLTIGLQITGDKAGLVMKCRNIPLKNQSETFTKRSDQSLLDLIDAGWDESIGSSTYEVLEGWVNKQLGAATPIFLEELDGYLKQLLGSDQTGKTIDPVINYPENPVIAPLPENISEAESFKAQLTDHRKAEILGRLKEEALALSFYAE